MTVQYLCFAEVAEIRSYQSQDVCLEVLWVCMLACL